MEYNVAVYGPDTLALCLIDFKLETDQLPASGEKWIFEDFPTEVWEIRRHWGIFKASDSKVGQPQIEIACVMVRVWDDSVTLRQAQAEMAEQLRQMLGVSQVQTHDFGAELDKLT